MNILADSTPHHLSSHCNEIRIIAEYCSLSLINIRHACTISAGDLVRSDGHTYAGSAQQNAAVLFTGRH